MVKKIFIVILVCLVSLVGLMRPVMVKGDYYQDLQKQIDELARARELSEAATKPLETELNRLENILLGIKSQLDQARETLKNLEMSIKMREGDLVVQHSNLAERVRSFYKRSSYFSPLLVFLSSSSASSLTRELAFRQKTTDQDKVVIIGITLDLVKLDEDKLTAEKDRIKLAALQVQVDKEAAFFRKEVRGAKDYQANLSSQIADLSARQQAIVSQRQASLNLPTSLGAGTMMCVDDRDDKYNPGFSNAYAFFTYGIPHRVGMNQYGAYGRAKAGQNSDQILRAYFNIDGYRDGVNATIKVNDSNGFNQGNVIWTGSLEDYVKRIYEIPASWPMASLKAQAIAARSYVLASTDNGNQSICANQNCQVFKTDPKGGVWDQAVSETSGKVMINGGQVIKAWYSSTDGGYTFTSGDIWGGDKPWTKRMRDTTGNVGSFGELNEKAYDKDSPCFYAAQGSRSEYNKSAWLKGEEVADIVNVIMLAKRDSGVGDHLYQTDKPHPYGGEIWSEEKVKQELRRLGGVPVDNVSSVLIGADFGSGKTTNVTVNGISFNGGEFKNWFNLRAPANIQIVGQLFNIEKK